MYLAIAALANERVLTAADFTPFIGQSTRMTIDRADMSDHWHLRNPNTTPQFTEVVTEVTIRRTFTDRSVVEVLVNLGDPLSSTGTLMHIDADELAIRIEDS